MMLSYIRTVNTILKIHLDLFQPITEKRNFTPDVAVTLLEAMNFGWRDGFANQKTFTLMSVT